MIDDPLANTTTTDAPDWTVDAGEGTLAPRSALAHRVCADGIVPYPPGIPVLVPGQVITADITEYLATTHPAEAAGASHSLSSDKTH